MLPAAGCSRNATWSWKHSEIFHSVLMARNASQHVRFWAGGAARSFPEVKPPLPRTARAEGAAPGPGAIPCPGNLLPLALACPGRQALLCAHKASFGMHTSGCILLAARLFFNHTVSFNSWFGFVLFFSLLCTGFEHLFYSAHGIWG